MLMPSSPAAERQDLRSVERLEIAIFVEDVVGGQQRLAKALIDGAAADERRGVEQRPSLVGGIGLRQADQHRRQAVELSRERVRAVPSCA